jgi:hypothetical protein
LATDRKLVAEIRDRLSVLNTANIDPRQAQAAVLALRQLAEQNDQETKSALALADRIESVALSPAVTTGERDQGIASLRAGSDWVVVTARLADGRDVTLIGLVARLRELTGHKPHVQIELYDWTLRGALPTEASDNAPS